MYYGTVSNQGAPNSIPTDTNRIGDPRVTEDVHGQAVHWPVDDISAWAAGNDYFTLVQWDEFNVSCVPATGYQENAVIVEDNATFITPDSGTYNSMSLT